MADDVVQHRRHGDASASTVAAGDDVDDERVSEWENGLPDVDDLTPLSQSMIPHDFANAFSISPEPYRTLYDVTRASDNTISSLRASNSVSSFHPAPVDSTTMMVIDEDVGMGGADLKKSRRMENTEEAEETLRTDNSADDESSARAMKRPRLVWTPQLHKRFVEVVSHLGLNNAVPKTIMQMMNVDGLTRENVASHLQKYRLYLKRQLGDEPAFSDQFFPTEPYPQQLIQQQPPPGMPPMVNPSTYHPFDSHHHFNLMQQHQHQHQQRDWSASNYASLASPAND